MSEMHKTFISFHHENDEWYKTNFESMFANYFDIFISRAVSEGDIDPDLATETIRQKIRDKYLRDSTVTVVLIWKRDLEKETRGLGNFI